MSDSSQCEPVTTAPTAEKDAPDCRCPEPKPDGRGNCSTCGRFACEYAHRGRTRCLPSICDCFIDLFPDSPRDLHPEAFIVGGVISPGRTEAVRTALDAASEGKR